MDCVKCKSLLNAYLDEELEESEILEVRAHVNSCPSCKDELDRLLRMRELLSNLRDMEVPPGEKEAFIDALRSKLEAEGAHVHKRPMVWRPVLVLAILAVIAMIVVVSVPKKAKLPVMEPAPGLRSGENVIVDTILMRSLEGHFIGTTGGFLADPELTRGQIKYSMEVFRKTHGDAGTIEERIIE